MSIFCIGGKKKGPLDQNIRRCFVLGEKNGRLDQNIHRFKRPRTSLELWRRAGCLCSDELMEEYLSDNVEEAQW